MGKLNPGVFVGRSQKSNNCWHTEKGCAGDSVNAEEQVSDQVFPVQARHRSALYFRIVGRGAEDGHLGTRYPVCEVKRNNSHL